MRCGPTLKKGALGVFCLAAIGAAALAADVDLAILPGELKLDGPEARHRVLVEELRGQEALGPVAEGVEVSSADPSIVRVEPIGGGVFELTPIANGRAAIVARRGGREARAEVSVSGFEHPFAWSFRNHVQPVLTKARCNSGACHGAAAGKNGFKLSLRGYDAAGDFAVLTRHARGRRIVPEDPGRSLVLTKPTGLIPHKGGTRFEPGSIDYRVLSEWIAQGTPPPRDDDPRLEGIEVLPSLSVLRAGQSRPLIVRGRYSDGSTRDVTRWVKFSGSDASVAQVDEDGKALVQGPGECAVTAWYQSKIAVALISVPFEARIDPQVFASAERRNFIDELVLEKLARLNLPPSPPAGDAEFLRRAFIDAVGVLPAAVDARAFLEDRSPGKHDRLIDQLLDRPEFVDYWSYKWSDLFLVSSEKLPPQALWSYYGWIRSQVAANAPWDAMARALITARGNTHENGAANFFVIHKDPLDMAETASVAFLGMSINCARCHNHPMEKWTNDQYYGMVSLFSRVRAKEAPGAGNATVFAAAEGEVIQPLRGRAQAPAPLDGEALDPEAAIDRREHFADWLTSPANPYFTRAIVNRVWASFFGVGLVEAVDDMRLTNPASNEKLLAALAAFLAENRYDLKALMRLILQSATYQRSSQALPENRSDRRFYSRYYPRRLMAEVLLDAFSQVLEAPTAFSGYPAGWRAMQLPDSGVQSYFLKSFGRPERAITCECERSAEPSMAQVLHIANGDTIHEKLRAQGNAVERLAAGELPLERVVEEAYLAALSRPPSAEETGKLLAVFLAASSASRRELIEDLYWGLLSSREFLFQH
jgi:hypothetical protein